MVTIISGLIQAGKSTLLQKLMEWGYTPVIEYTTRPMRKEKETMWTIIS